MDQINVVYTAVNINVICDRLMILSWEDVSDKRAILNGKYKCDRLVALTRDGGPY